MLRDDTASPSSKLEFNNLETSPSRSSHRIEFPSNAPDPIPSETKNAQLSQKTFSSSLLSRSTTAPRSSADPEADTAIDLTRASLDRRISLPLLGIDLGRSGPSYGQTLKRMSVAVYGVASDAFEYEDMAVKDSTSRSKPPPGVAARPLTDARPSLSISATDQENTCQSSNSRSSSSNDATNLQKTNEDGHGTTALQSLATNTLQPVLLNRRRSLQTSQVSTLKIQRDLQARKLNLPFKGKMRYPLREGKLKFPSHSDPNTHVHPSTDTHEDPKLPHTSLYSSKSPLDETVRETKRNKKRQIVQELIETERRYFDLLTKIELNYIIPIQASQRTNDYQKMILSRKTAAHIFSNFTAILGLSRQFLTSLEKFGRDYGIFDEPASAHSASNSEVPVQSPTNVIRSHTKSTISPQRGFNIGEMMIQYLPFFKLYTTFTSNFSVSQSTLHLHSAKRGPSPEFVKLLEDCCQRGIDGGLGLAHMLLSIIQRVPRYELLIKELVKHSIQTDCDYNDLLSAQKMVGCVVRGLEIGMSEQTEAKTILTIQRATEGLPFPLVIPSRKLIKIGQLKKIGRKGDLQDRIFFLFNDCLIYSGTIRNGNVESVEKWLGHLTASLKKSNNASSFPASLASSTTIKPITTSFLLPFTYGDDNSPRLIFCRKMQLDDITTIGAVSGQKNNPSTAFQIISSSKSFIVYTRDASEKENWISCLRETKSELLDSRRTLFIKEDSRDPFKFDKLGYIAESPSQETCQLPFTSTREAFNSDPRKENTDRTPEKTRRENAATFFPVVSACRSSGAVTGSMITSLLSPRTRHTSSFTRPFNFNWKNLVQLGIPPITAQTTKMLKDVQQDNSESLKANTTSQIESNVLPESSPTDQVSNNQVEECKQYVAENYCAPVWVPDSHVNRCMGQCQTWFNVLKRRHHCRLCGGVFCSSCSSRMFLIKNREQGDQIARACEDCFKSVFLDLDPKEIKPTNGEPASYRPILSNRLHDDQELLFRRERPHLKHSHRQSLPIDMGSAHFRHSLANIRDDDQRRSILSQRRSIVSVGTSVGGESMCENSKNDLNGALNVEISIQQNQKNSPNPVSSSSYSPQPTHARQRLSSLLQSQIR